MTRPIERRFPTGIPTETGWYYMRRIPQGSYQFDPTQRRRTWVPKVGSPFPMEVVHVEVFKNKSVKVAFKEDGNGEWHQLDDNGKKQYTRRFEWFGPVTQVEPA